MMAAAPQNEIQSDTQPEVVGSIDPPPRGEFRLQTERVEKLAARLESAGDPEIRATALDLVQSVVELHGAALQRLVDSLMRTPAGQQILSEALENDLISSMLLLHNLHLDDLETRVLRGIEKARPYLKSHGGDVELAAVRDGLVPHRHHATYGS